MATETTLTPSLYVSPEVGIGQLMIAAAQEGVMKKARRDQANRIAAALEAHARHVIASCAARVVTPRFEEGPFPTPRVLKRYLSPSARSRMIFADRREFIWTAIRNYFEPIREAERSEGKGKGQDPVADVTWTTYLLVLAARRRSEVVLNPVKAVEAIEKIRSERRLSAEGLTRLAILEGLFGSYGESVEVPGLRFRAHTASIAIRDRIEEVLEDAYLLEASEMRRFFGLGANVSSLRRDLRALVRFIAKARPWAKAIVSAGKVSGHMGSTEAVGALLDQLNGGAGDYLAPLCIDPTELRLAIADSREADVWIFGRVFGGFTIRALKGESEDVLW